jgi:arginine deiminase
VTFHVDSEVGRLRQVILHKPGLELSRLTPTNVEELLFDDVLWSKRAREEHDAFAAALRDCGVTVHYFEELLAAVLEQPEGRSWVLDRVLTPDTAGPTLVQPLRALADDVDSARLAELLVGGVIKSDLSGLAVNSLRWELMRRDDFLLTPLPNHLFQRDNSAWIYNGVSINPMAKEARIRESVHSTAIYKFHPMFAGSDFEIWYGGDDERHQPATLEGGDIHVLGNGTVMVGMGERSTPMGVENLARSLFAKRAADKVIAIELPHSHAMMHLDTVMTMLDRATFIVFPYLHRRPIPRTSTVSRSRRTTISSPRSPRSSTSTRSRCSRPTRMCARRSASSGTTARTSWRSSPASSWDTTATSRPTPTCVATASR